MNVEVHEEMPESSFLFRPYGTNFGKQAQLVFKWNEPVTASPGQVSRKGQCHIAMNWE